MAYQQVHKGKTFPPGSTFPDFCKFENCTFQATCTFGVGCHFITCTFQKCCYPHYNNSPSQVKSGIVVNSTLESVSLDKNTLGHNNKNTGYMVTDMSYIREGVTHGTAQRSDKMECCELGVSLSPTDVGVVAVCPDAICKKPRGIKDGHKG